MRVPALANWPGFISLGTTTELMTTIDLVPTIMSLVQGIPPEKTHGFDMTNLLLFDQKVLKFLSQRSALIPIMSLILESSRKLSVF